MTAVWTPVIFDENRQRAYLDLDTASSKARFAEDGFIVAIVRDTAMPEGQGPAYTPQRAFMARDVAHEAECHLEDPVDELLSLRAHWARACVMAGALNGAEQYLIEATR